MDFKTVLDISSIIWEKTDYDANTHQYYSLINGVAILFEKLKKEKPKILLRNELLDEMINGFPFDSMPNHFYDFGKIVYSFLSNIGSDIIRYPNQITTDIASIPNLIKAHYNEATKNEVFYLISKIHSDSESQNVYFTFEYLWDDEVDKLKTEVGEETKEYETIISDKENELEEFFVKFKPTFEHNPKHDKTVYNTKEQWEKTEVKDGFVSRLSCYNNFDNIEPKRILESRYPKKLGDSYYGFDTVNEVYVIFRHTRLNIYHGYDENNPNRIPNEVRKHFNK